jgi:mono/diheme cytochrome c family protein
MIKQTRTLLGISAALLLGAGVIGAGLVSQPTDACAQGQQVSFKEDIFPIFKGRCVECHQSGGAGFEKSGLDLSTHAGLMKGTKFGPMVTPRDADSSNLMWLLDWRAKPELRMPHGNKKLSTCDRDAIRKWINQGAKDN